MSLVELPAPGVEVVQQIQTTSPTVALPTLPACNVGLCRQIVEVLSSTGGTTSLNSDALVALPAFFLTPAALGDPPVFTGLDGLSLDLSVNNGPTVSIVFEGASMTPDTLVRQISEALADAAVTELIAEKVGEDRVRVRTIATGDFQSILVEDTTAPAVAAALGVTIGFTYVGRSGYDQYQFQVPPPSMPDPRGNLDELSIDYESVRVFLALGNGAEIREVLRTESFLRRGGVDTAAQLVGNVALTGLTYSAPAVVTGGTDVTAGALYGGGGTLNGLTVILTVNGEGPTTLTLTGTGNAANQPALFAAIAAAFPGLVPSLSGTNLRLTSVKNGNPNSSIVVGAGTANAALGLSPGTTNGTNGTITNQTLVISSDGGADQTVTFDYPASAAALLGQINAVIGSLTTASQAPSTNYLQLTSIGLGADYSVEVVSGTGVAALGLSAALDVGVSGVAAVDDGNGDAVTSYLKFDGQNFTTAAGRASVEGSVNVTTLSYPGDVAGLTITLGTDEVAQTYTVGSPAAYTDLLAELESFFPDLEFDVNATHLRVRTPVSTVGDEAVVKVVGGSLLSVVGLVAGVYRGAPKPPVSGDDLYVDGARVGRITQVAPGGQNDVLKIDKFLPIDASFGSTFYIIAKNLGSVPTSTRPAGDLIIDLLGNVTIKHDLLRDTTGAAIANARASIYVAYRAIRLDVSPIAQTPGLLRFDSIESIEDQIGPISVLNPLALASYLSILNAPNSQVTGLGVDEAAPDAPFGTAEGFARAAEYLEAYEVYGIAPLTHDESVAQVFNTHVISMSDPAAKNERICVFNFSRPSARVDKLVASGVTGNSTVATQFDTGIVNLSQLVLAAGVSPVGTIAADSGLFLDIASDSKRYSIQSISGSVVTIRTSFAAGENDDFFYATTDLNDPPLPSILVDEAFAVRVRGAALVLSDGVTPDRQAIAETYQAKAQGFRNRRFWSVVPDQVKVELDGLEQLVEGFYACSGIVGAIGEQAPQLSFTNFPMTGYTGVVGSNDFFTGKQLNIIAGGGNYILVNPRAGNGPIFARMALTSDMTSVEVRTDSITKVLDFSSKFIRESLKGFIGRFNITQGLLDTLGQVLEGLLSFLRDTGVINGSQVLRIVQDQDNPDTVLIQVQLDVPYPCNYIRVTLVI